MKRKPKRVWHVYREPVSGWYTLSKYRESRRGGTYVLLSQLDWRYMGMKALRRHQRAKVTVTIEAMEIIKHGAK